MDTRDPSCVKNWPECETGEYNPKCCRFPKSCSVRSNGYVNVEPRERTNMDELVYFSASFHCIPMKLADQMRELLLGMDIQGQFNFDYSKPIIQEED